MSSTPWTAYMTSVIKTFRAMTSLVSAEFQTTVPETCCLSNTRERQAQSRFLKHLDINSEPTRLAIQKISIPLTRCRRFKSYDINQSSFLSSPQGHTSWKSRQKWGTKPWKQDEGCWWDTIYIYIYIYIYTHIYIHTYKGKVIPLQARCGPEGG